MKVRFKKENNGNFQDLYALEDKISKQSDDLNKLSDVLHIKEKREKIMKIALICLSLINIVLVAGLVYKEEIKVIIESIK